VADAGEGELVEELSLRRLRGGESVAMLAQGLVKVDEKEKEKMEFREGRRDDVVCTSQYCCCFWVLRVKRA
jgi:hypothetical protein